MRKNIEQILITIIGVSMVLIVIIACALIVRRDNKVHQSETEERIVKQKYNLTHPEIIGTNENGLEIKCYYLPIQGHYIYSIGETVTDNHLSGGKIKYLNVEAYTTNK